TSGATAPNISAVTGVDKDTVIYAVWREAVNTITVTATLDGAEDGSKVFTLRRKGADSPISANTDGSFSVTDGDYEVLDENGDVVSEVTADGGNESVTVEYFTVTFDTQGGSGVSAQIVRKGEKAKPPAPATAKEGYNFYGWFTEQEDGAAFDFNAPITDTTTVYAQWGLTPPPPDTTPPTGEIKIRTNPFTSFLNTITFGLFFKNTANVSITATDDSGEPVTIQYALATEAFADSAAAEAAAWTAYPPAGFSMNPGDKYIVYAKLTDTSGNTVIINTQGAVVFEDSEPSVSKDYERGSADLPVSVAMNGNTVKGITRGGQTLTEGVHYTTDADEIIFSKTYLDTLTDGDEVFTVTYYPQGVTAEPIPVADTDAIGTTEITVSITTPPPPTYTVSGLVVDENDDPIPGVEVEIYKGNNKIDDTVTDSAGYFEITDVPADVYNLVLTHPAGQPIRTKKIIVDRDISFTTPPIVMHGILSTLINIDGDLPISAGDLDAMLNPTAEFKTSQDDDVTLTLADIMWFDADAGALRVALYAHSFNEDDNHNTDKQAAVDGLKDLARQDDKEIFLWLNVWVNKYLFENVDDYISANDIYNSSPNYKEPGYDAPDVNGYWEWYSLTLLPELIRIHIPLAGTDLSGEQNLAVYRRHKGEFQVLPADTGEEYYEHNTTDDSITLFVKLFSEYAIAKPAAGGLAQTIAIANPGAKTFGDPPFTLTLSDAGSGTGSVTYMLDPSYTGTQAGTVSPAGVVTITGEGKIHIIAVKEACGTYSEAVSPTLTITVTPKPPATPESPPGPAPWPEAGETSYTPPAGTPASPPVTPATPEPAPEQTPEPDAIPEAPAEEAPDAIPESPPGPAPLPEPEPVDDVLPGPERSVSNPQTGDTGVTLWLWLGAISFLMAAAILIGLKKKE
ncbi:MAG: InlB B-repeat-containing protein, partial [Oscillospiraceae bacterium]|nr:InlB B-repeat-containing protein [Oscillospiraceae bacterium]